MERGGESSGVMVCVVGSEYCSDKAVELVVVSNVMVPKPDIFVSNCMNNKTIFTVEDRTSACGLHKRRVLLDRHGAPILSFKDKVMTLHHRWRVYKGSRGDDKKDLIFSAKQSSITGHNKELNVFLASNKEEKICDFRVVEASSGMFYFYLGDSIIIAEMFGFTAKVYRNVDQAFIVSLIVILNAMNHSQGKGGHVAKLMMNVTILSIGMLIG